jgi:hypothetical protein
LLSFISETLIQRVYNKRVRYSSNDRLYRRYFISKSSCIIIITITIIIIIGKNTISFMQGIYTYIPETNHVPKEYNVLLLLWAG